MPDYTLFGAHLHSEVALTTLPACVNVPTAAVRIHISSDAALASVTAAVTAAATSEDAEMPAGDWRSLYVLSFASADDEPFMTVFRGPQSYLVRVHQRADFEVSHSGDAIGCRAFGGVPWSTVEQLLVDQIVPRALQLCGKPCLHASAVAKGESVLALVGQAGAGKSTTTAALCERGWALVCDDCLALNAQENKLWVEPGYPSVRLWPDSAERLLGTDHQLPLASPRTNKLRKSYPVERRPRALRGIVALQPWDNAETHIARLSGREAFALLATTLHRLTPQGSRVLDAEFSLLTAVAEHVPVLRLSYRQHFADQAALLDRIEQAFAQFA